MPRRRDVLVAALIGCGGQRTTDTAAPLPTVSALVTASATAATVSRAPTVVITHGPREGRELDVTVTSEPGMGPVDLDGQLWLERIGGPPSWMDGHPWGFAFDPACDGGAPRACISLAPGTSLRYERWNASSCEGRCGLLRPCGGVGIVPIGEYRFYVRSCDGKRRFEGKPFHWP